MLSATNWQLEKPIHAVIFDCDGTLSTIEGIDELAKQNQAGDQVQALTELAMGKTGINPQIYRERLELVYPKQEQVHALGSHYHVNAVADVQQVINILQRLGKSVYVISAGLRPAVTLFGEQLNIPSNRIFAVDVFFDEQGNYVGFDHTSPLVSHDGKRQIIAQLKEQHASIAHIGDGMNDYVAYDLVTRFIGYGGAFYREQIAALCDYYIRTKSLSPMLPLLLTQAERNLLLPDEASLYQQGLKLLNSHANMV